MSFLRIQKRKRISGFTLVELVVVIGIVAVLVSITLVAINPLEQFNQAADVSTKALTKEFTKATNIYFGSEKTYPWKKNTSCRDELASGDALDTLPSCLEELTKGGKLQEEILAKDETRDVHVTECSDQIAVCYKPKSTSFKQDTEAKYTKNGYLQSDCSGGAQECYACTFSTPQAQECFQALHPNGPLAVVPSIAPDSLLPIPQRHAKKSCSDPIEGQVACMADMVTDATGNPLTSVALPAGFGPTQLHTAYNLPCTPGGTVQSICQTPQAFGPQTIGIVIAYHSPTVEQDLAVYNQTYGLPPCTKANGCLTVVNQSGNTSYTPSTDASWALEEALDVQIAHTICQTCKILVVESTTNNWTDIVAAVNTAAALGAHAISNSYGAPEHPGHSYYDTYYNHPGTYVVAASGDWGYGSYYPAASKYVIAVGGTTLSLYGNYSYASETVWSGTGSGCALYQSANSFQTTLANWAATGCGTKRSINDVSAVANPSTGVAIYNSTSYGGRTGWWIVGGTSLSSPLISAALLLDGYAPSGQLGTTSIYANANKYRDVISGSNGSCGGSIMCTAKAGYDGPTGLGSPNWLPPVSDITTPTPTTQSQLPIPTPTPSPTTTPTPTLAPLSCTSQQTVVLSQTQPIIALPGDTVNNILTVTNNDPEGCSTTFTISRGFPTNWTVSGIPTSFTLAGGAQKIIPFSVTVPTTATAGNYGYQIWVAKQGQSTVNPVNGSIQVTQLGPTNTPTPTPISCFQGWTSSLGSTSMSGNAGDTLNQTITITNNNPASCGSALFTFSYAHPSLLSIFNLPPSVRINGGESITIPFTITISTGAQIQDYLMQIWVNNSTPTLNTTIHVLATGNAPEAQMFSNFGAKLYRDYAIFEFSYNQNGTNNFRLDVATNPTALEQTSGTNSAISYGFSSTTGRAMDATNITTPTSIRGFLRSSPQSWSGWQCGTTIYWRMYNGSDIRIKSPIQSGNIDCTTTIDVLPWSPWYAAIYQGVYDARYDTDSNGVVDWNDYWVLVRATRLR